MSQITSNLDQSNNHPNPITDLLRELSDAMSRRASAAELTAAVETLRQSFRGKQALELFQQMREIGLDYRNWQALETLCRAIGSDIPNLPRR